MSKSSGYENHAEILIYGPIGFGTNTAEEFIGFASKIKSKKILVRINSPGGSFFDAQAISSYISSMNPKPVIWVDGIAASAASYILGSSPTRVATDGSMIMIHNPTMGTYGDSEEHKKSAEILEKITSQLISSYTAISSYDEEKVRSLMSEETWFTSKEAMESGIITSLVKKESPKVCCNVDEFCNNKDKAKEACKHLLVANEQRKKRTQDLMKMVNDLSERISVNG